MQRECPLCTYGSQARWDDDDDPITLLLKAYLQSVDQVARKPLYTMMAEYWNEKVVPSRDSMPMLTVSEIEDYYSPKGCAGIAEAIALFKARQSLLDRRN